MSPASSGRPSPARAARESAAAARAAERARRARERRVRRTAIIVVIALVVIGGGVAWWSSRPDTQAALPAGVSEPGGPIVLGAKTGSGGSKVPVVDVWEDFQCPYCKQFEQASGQLLTSYARQGKITVRYHLASFLGPESARAANAAACASDAGRFPAYHAALYEHQPAEGAGGYTVDELRAIGRSVGLTSPEFTQCVAAGTYGEWVRAVQHSFDTSGLHGTPSVLVDGTLLTPEQMTPNGFAAHLAQAVAGG
jgi:protein-disulfide isomerase